MLSPTFTLIERDLLCSVLRTEQATLRTCRDDARTQGDDDRHSLCVVQLGIVQDILDKLR